MVCYGKDNNGQAYGGGIVYGSRYIYNKPCFFDVIDDKNNVAVVYIHFHYSIVHYYRQSGNIVLRVIIYGR